MEQKGLWVKLSGSINYFIKGVWKEQLLQSNEELLEEYLTSVLKEEDASIYQYLDKKTYEYIKLDKETVERVKIAFLDRIEKKKIKYYDEIQEVRSKIQNSGKNVVEFSKYKK